MSIKERILFILEGDRSERTIVSSLQRCLFPEGTFIECVFDAEIYQLYQKLKDYDFATDIVELLRTRTKENEVVLRPYTRDSFAYTYLFFDYDAHSSLADDNKLCELLEYFDNETEHGKLFVSYPMIEALRHFRDIESFRTLTVKCKGQNCPNALCEERGECLARPHYKTIVPQENKPRLNNLHYDNEVWKELTMAHLNKINELVYESFSFPTNVPSQKDVFDKQMKKYILKDCPHVSVLSAFPPFTLDYYGCDTLLKKLSQI